YSGAHSRVLYVRDYLSSAADEAHVIPEYVYGTGSSAVGKITEFLQAIIDGIRQLADSVWQNILPGWAYLKEHFRKLLTVRWEERIVRILPVF
ncbi:unnamed protein product, partial [Anisakis simplex]|uniref:ISKra4 family transposase n=1 Tax=Anisakis simplex TaxID=6269 RepID=A0A0M3JCY6_ANISI